MMLLMQVVTKKHETQLGSFEEDGMFVKTI